MVLEQLDIHTQKKISLDTDLTPLTKIKGKWSIVLDVYYKTIKTPRQCHRRKPNDFGYAAAKSLQSCPTLCDPIDGSPPGSAVPGILEARTLEWVAISFSNA